MPKNTTTYWNPLLAENEGQRKTIEGGFIRKKNAQESFLKFS